MNRPDGKIRSPRRITCILLAACFGFTACPALAITTPAPISPPALSAPGSSSGTYEVSWGYGFDTIMLYESPNGTANWTTIYHGDAISTTSKGFNYNYGGIRYYRAKGCASINGNVPSCSDLSATISVNVSGRSAKPVTAVVLGDGYASGEAGRWRGNFDGEPIASTPDRMGTDALEKILTRGPDGGYINTPIWSSVYQEDSVYNGCNRSVSAPIHRLSQFYFLVPPLMIKGPFKETVNLACSRARNKNLWHSADGGEALKGELPQITQLSNLVLSHDIKLITLNIGGMDVGINNALMTCVKGWAVKHWASWLDGEVAGYGDEDCDGYIQSEIIPKLGDAYVDTARSITLIRQEMLRQGKSDPEDYRIVLMGYPSIIAGFSDNRYSNAHEARLNPGRCAFNGPDSDFVNQVLMTKLSGMYEALAHDESVDFISTRNLLQGHELCHVGSSRASSSTAASAENMEWVRYTDTIFQNEDDIGDFEDRWEDVHEPFGGRQGKWQESMYPNQFGQEAIGSCLRKWWQQRESVPGPYTCTNPNPDSTKRVAIAKLPPPTFGQISTSGLIPNATLLGEAPGGGDLYQPGELLRSKVFTQGQNEYGGMARVEVKINHADRGDLRIFLRSPSGVEHHIRSAQPTYAGPFPPVSRNYLPFAVWEPGTWTLVMHDTRNPGGTGTFQDFKIWWF